MTATSERPPLGPAGAAENGNAGSVAPAVVKTKTTPATEPVPGIEPSPPVTTPSQSTAEHKRKAKFDDVAVTGGALEQDGRTVAAQLQKMRDYEATAYEKAGYELGKLDQFEKTLKQTLVDVKKKCTPAGYKAFKEKWCPGLKRSRIDRLLLIGRGEKTLKEARAEDAARKRKSRAKKKDAVTVTATVVPPPEPKATLTGAQELRFVMNRRLPKMSPAEKAEFLTYVLQHPDMAGVKPRRN